MRHVGRRDPETNLLITEVTQAEFDALPNAIEFAESSAAFSAGSMWRLSVRRSAFALAYVYGVKDDEPQVARRRLVIVDQAEPSTLPSTSVISADASAFV